MLLLLPKQPKQISQLVFIFGVGLIGLPIARFLQQMGFIVEQLDLCWDDYELQAHQLEGLQQRVKEVIQDSRIDQLSIIWSAGRAGFDSSEEQTDRELISFLAVLDMVEVLTESYSDMSVDFHMLSSVGGLFEGQRQIDSTSSPKPLRPYGLLKMRQEDALFARGSIEKKFVYRLTSVFGIGPLGTRHGLVSTLLRNTSDRQVTHIVGRMSSLRDFIWNADVARYIALRLRYLQSNAETIQTLASGKPSSIQEVIRIVESATGKRGYLRFVSELTNELDITVSPSLSPEGWFPTGLKTAILTLTATD